MSCLRPPGERRATNQDTNTLMALRESLIWVTQASPEQQLLQTHNRSLFSVWDSPEPSMIELMLSSTERLSITGLIEEAAMTWNANCILINERRRLCYLWNDCRFVLFYLLPWDRDPLTKTRHRHSLCAPSINRGRLITDFKLDISPDWRRSYWDSRLFFSVIVNR